MDSDKYRINIDDAKKYYRGIGCIRCPAFNNEEVYFNRKGFQHLLYKKGDRRSKHEQIKRLSLLGTAVEILRDSNGFVEHRSKENIKFWSFQRRMNVDTVTVIVAQIDDGQKYFLSVMTKSTKTP